jgi:hypothetical protein
MLVGMLSDGLSLGYRVWTRMLESSWRHQRLQGYGKGNPSSCYGTWTYKSLVGSVPISKNCKDTW